MQKVAECLKKRRADDDTVQSQTVYFGKGKEEENKKLRATNRTRTSKYTLLSWAPLSLLYQFTRVANIYFLIISILTAMPFSPKSPGSMIGTFSAVLIFTMFKELFEDYFRMKSDREVNNTKSYVLNHETKKFEQTPWKNIQLGDVIRISKDESFPCDMLFIYSRNDVIFVDTMNLDGETNLKPKTIVSLELHDYIRKDLESRSIADAEEPKHRDGEHHGNHKLNKYVDRIDAINGTIESGGPSENLENWDANVHIDTPGTNNNIKCHAGIDSLLLRGCYLRNVDYCYGIAVYLGKETKIMMNAKKPPRKVSNLMKMMNYMLYTIFLFQFLIIIVFASCSVGWISSKGSNYAYLDLHGSSAGFGKWIIQLLTYWVAYSHMIPISLYVMIEVLKLTQASLIKYDREIGADEESDDKPAECKNSDLIEELGQVDFIFSDKTGTLTCNQMIFKSCSIGGKVYVDKEDKDSNQQNKAPNSKVGLNSSYAHDFSTDTPRHWEDE